MTDKEKLALLEDTIEAEEGSLSPAMELKDVEEYDSVAKLSIIVMMEDEFGRKIDSATVKGFATVGDIMALMSKE
ncbi:MAG: hypothetical protein IJP89_10395 [Synergistaceae bacterium]|nr:hypothetical protein [Synergistaceae bacterium]